MKMVKILMIVLVMLIYKAQIFSQAPNYSGKWVLNNEISKIQSRPDGMTSSVFIIHQKGNNFSLTIHHVFGNQQDTVVINMLSDGKTRKVLNVLQGKLEQQKDGLHITLWKKGFLDKVTYKYGKDKNQFIADEVLISDSDNHHNIWVFEKKLKLSP